MSTTKEVIAKLGQQERTTGLSGAVPRMPKQQMLDASDVQAKHPDKHIRFVNLQNPDKVESRKHDGYVRLTSEEGGKHLGDSYALFALPRHKYDERVRAVEAENSRRLVAHEAEVEAAVEGIVRLMRDRYGVKIDAKRLLINEG